MDILIIVLLAVVTGLSGYLAWRTVACRRKVQMLTAIIDAHRTPVLFYDGGGSLAYINSQAETVFEQIPADIQSYEFIEQSSNPEGPHLHLTDRFGNGYRLEVVTRPETGRPGGKIVFVKGYAQVRPNPR